MASIDKPPAKASRSERGKLAQRAYRKRHASKFQKLQEDNKGLRAVIARLDSTLRTQGLLSAEVAAILGEARGLCADEDASDGSSPAEQRQRQRQRQSQRPGRPGGGAADGASSSSADPCIEDNARPSCEEPPQGGRVTVEAEAEEAEAAAAAGDSCHVARGQSTAAAAGDSCHVARGQSTAAAPSPPAATPASSTPSFGSAGAASSSGGSSPATPATPESAWEALPWIKGISVQLPGIVGQANVGHYLGEGMLTLGGCIYWACITQSVEVFEDFKARLVRPGSSGAGAQRAAEPRLPFSFVAVPDAAPAGRTVEWAGMKEPPNYLATLHRVFAFAELLGEPGFLARIERCRDHFLLHGHVVPRRDASPLLTWANLPADHPWPIKLGESCEYALSGSTSTSTSTSASASTASSSSSTSTKDDGGQGPWLPRSTRRPNTSPWWRCPQDVLVHLESQIGREAMARLDAFVRRAPAVVKGAADGTASARDVLGAKRLGSLVLALSQNYASTDVGLSWNSIYLSLLIGSWVDGNREWIYSTDAEVAGP